MTLITSTEVVFWSRAGISRTDPALSVQAPGAPQVLEFEPNGRYYAGRLRLPNAGTLVLQLQSPRPIRMWADGILVLDEELYWRHYQRELRAAIVLPVDAGELALLVEVGQRPKHPRSVDDDCPSRNREHVMDALLALHPDFLSLSGSLWDTLAPAISLRFSPAQFHQNDVTWQHILVRSIQGVRSTPSTTHWPALGSAQEFLYLTTCIPPCDAYEGSDTEDAKAGIRRFYVPVASPGHEPPPLRRVGPEVRVEPNIEVARVLTLTVGGREGSVTLQMPAYESLGRYAPRREYRKDVWPSFAEAHAQLPEPVLPSELSYLEELYYAAWQMLFVLVRWPRPDSGLPGSYISTGSGFKYHQFVWDTSFTAICTAYASHIVPYTASMDLLYSRQFDGGYINRENDVIEGLPTLYEPDFSPNPPIMSLAEWAMASNTGDLVRLRKVYPLLRDYHMWLEYNRQLPDGTFWTTGLANGLDNSPSLGDGYPDLTAQMAHDAEILGKIAQALGFSEEAAVWFKRHREIGRCLNDRLWNEEQQIYSTSLPSGGHNPSKVVTAFWPLWAGVVPSERVDALARHLKDPASFWRHHPIPSLAADSPYFAPEGRYWRGSTWAPTNYAAIKGFYRVGKHALARETALRHLQCMYEVFRKTGKIWENYCSEASVRGSQSMPDYSWSALGPVALLFEVLMGIELDALAHRIRWNPPSWETVGVRNLSLGSTVVSIVLRHNGTGRTLEVTTGRPFVLELVVDGVLQHVDCQPGRTAIALGNPEQCLTAKG